METKEEVIKALLVEATMNDPTDFCFNFNLFTRVFFLIFWAVSLVVYIKSSDKLEGFDRKNINIKKEQFTSLVSLILFILFLVMSVMDWCKILSK